MKTAKINKHYRIVRCNALSVGKARDLRKRLSPYAHFAGPIHSKTAVMLSQPHSG